MLYSRHSAEATTLNRAVAYFLAKDMQPVYTVKKSGFKFLVSKLNPRYSLPSRKNFTEVEIPKLYVEVRAPHSTLAIPDSTSPYHTLL